MPIAIFLLIIDVALIAHAAKTGRFQPWGYIILMVPGLGAAAYVVAEMLPEWLGSYRGQVARETMARAMNPGRLYRELSDRLALVDTIATRAALAQECLMLGRFEEALAHYAAILAQPLAEEPHFFLGRARAQFGLGQPAMAIATLDELMQRWPDFRSPDGHLLYAIALEENGRAEEALANYANVGEYFPGVEPRVRQAQLLQKLGRDVEAKAVAQDVMRGLRQAPAHVRRNQRPWLVSARRLARS